MAKPNTIRKTKLTDAERQRVLMAMLLRSTSSDLKRGDLSAVAATEGIHPSTISRLWAYAKVEAARSGHFASPSRRNRSGRTASDPTPTRERLHGVDVAQRSTIRSAAAGCGMAPTTRIRQLRQGRLRTHTSVVKPVLTDANKAERLQFALPHIRRDTMDPLAQENARTIDELIAAVTEAYWELPARTINSTFLSVQGSMDDCIAQDGDNNYKPRHMKKEKLRREGRLPVSIRCCTSAELHAPLLDQRRTNLQARLWKSRRRKMLPLAVRHERTSARASASASASDKETPAGGANCALTISSSPASAAKEEAPGSRSSTGLPKMKQTASTHAEKAPACNARLRARKPIDYVFAAQGIAKDDGSDEDYDPKCDPDDGRVDDLEEIPRTVRTAVQRETLGLVVGSGPDTGGSAKNNTDKPKEVEEEVDVDARSKRDGKQHVTGFEASIRRFVQAARVEAEEEAASSHTAA
ncbi:hypothetical protein PC128_g8875 [Phytophthora cactorum]|nr:hypothetical protein C6341_g18103 [Phytophthora cactorum]KAG3194976.1 hypothetical protein PC128_g8875 [Phytophthora cactorum]